MSSLLVHPNCYKIFFYFFFLQSIRMSEKTVNFRGKKIKKSDSYKNKKVTNIDDIDANKILISKECRMVKKIHLSNLFDTMIMILLDHYA